MSYKGRKPFPFRKGEDYDRRVEFLITKLVIPLSFQYEEYHLLNTFRLFVRNRDFRKTSNTIVHQ
jgi:hypothetical protein